MKNKKVLIFISLTLVAIACLLYLKNGNTIKTTKDNFAINTNTIVTKIQITKNKNTSSLELINNQWIVNNSTTINNNIAEQFIEYLQNISINSTVRKNQKNQLAEILQTDGFFIEIFEQNKNIKAYYINSNIYKKHLTYAKLKNSRTPYVVEIPSLDKEMISIFDLSAEIWHPRNVFNFKYAFFSGLDFKNTKKPQRDFSINKMNDYFSIKYSDNKQKKISQQELQKLLTIFSDKQYINNTKKYSNTLIDSICSINPFLEITIKLTNDTLKYNFYTKPTFGEKDAFGEELIIDPNLFLINTPNQQLFTCKYYDFEDILSFNKAFIE